MGPQANLSCSVLNLVMGRLTADSCQMIKSARYAVSAKHKALDESIDVERKRDRTFSLVSFLSFAGRKDALVSADSAPTC
jgi:hypothetical protein